MNTYQRDEKARKIFETSMLLREKQYHEFAIKYGFAYKRAQDYKNCIVIRWKLAIKNGVSNDKLEEYINICRYFIDKYKLDDPKHVLLDHHLKLYHIGIYVGEQFGKYWAIPNEFSEIQAEVLSRVPKWAKVSRKKSESPLQIIVDRYGTEVLLEHIIRNFATTNNINLDSEKLSNFIQFNLDSIGYSINDLDNG